MGGGPAQRRDATCRVEMVFGDWLIGRIGVERDGIADQTTWPVHGAAHLSPVGPQACSGSLELLTNFWDFFPVHSGMGLGEWHHWTDHWHLNLGR